MTSFKTSDGLSLAFADEGAGLPVLCLAGLTRNMVDFEPVVEGFADRYRIIRLDTRGRGGSDHDPNWENYTVEVEARDALELADHLGLSRFAVIGASRGGLLAMAMAMDAPTRLAGVLLNDVGPELAEDAIQRISGYVGVAPVFKTHDQAAMGLKAFNDPAFPGLDLAFWRRFSETTFEEVDDGLALTYDPGLRDALISQAEAGPLPDLWPMFDALAGIPLACLRGENSDLLTTATFRAMQDRRPDMIATTVPARGHMPFLDEAESVATIAALLELASAQGSAA